MTSRTTMVAMEVEDAPAATREAKPSAAVPSRGEYRGTKSRSILFAPEADSVGKTRRGRRARLWAVLAAVVVAALALGLGLGLGLRDGRSLSPAEQLALSHDVVNAAAAKIVVGNQVILNAATLGDAAAATSLKDLLASLGVSGGQLVLDLLSGLGATGLDPSDFVIGFPNLLAACPSASSLSVDNGSYAGTGNATLQEVDGLPVRVFRGNGTVLGGPASVVVALFVGAVSSDPQVELAVRVDLGAGTLLNGTLPALAGTASWLDGATVGAGGTVVVSTADFVTDTFELRRGVNVRAVLAVHPAAQFVSSFVSFANSTAAPQLRLTGFVPFALFTGSRPAPRSSASAPDARFDLRLVNAGLRLGGQVGVVLDQVDLRATGLGRPGIDSGAPQLAMSARASIEADGTNNSVEIGISGSWDAASGQLEFNVCTRSINLPDLAEYVVLDSVRGRLLLTVRQPSAGGGSVHLDLAELEGLARIPPLGGNLQASVYVSLTGGAAGTTVRPATPPQFGLLAQAPVAGVRGLKSGICKFANFCGSLGVVDDLGLDSLVLRLGVANRATVVRGVKLQAGVTVWGEATGLRLPADLLHAAEVLGVNSNVSALSVGLNIPPRASGVSDLVVFVGFGETPAGVGNMTATNVPTGMFSFKDSRGELRPLATPPSASLAVTGQADGLSDAGPLLFTASATLTASGSIVLEGYMSGEWTDVAGVTGFDVADVGFSLGFGLGTGITEVGVYGSFMFGANVTADFALLLSQARGKFALQAYVVNLSAASLVEFAEQASGVNVPDAVVTAVQDLLGLRIDFLNVTIAPVSVVIGPRTIDAGFFARGVGKLLGANFDLDVQQTSNEVVLAGQTIPNFPDFELGFAIGNFGLDSLISPMVNALKDIVLAPVQLLLGSLVANVTLCCCEPFFVGGCVTVEIRPAVVTDFLDTLVSKLAGVFHVNNFSLSHFRLSDVLSGNNDPVLAFNGTLLDIPLDFNVTIPVSFFAKPAVGAASFLFQAFEQSASGVGNLFTVMADAVAHWFGTTFLKRTELQRRLDLLGYDADSNATRAVIVRRMEVLYLEPIPRPAGAAFRGRGAPVRV